MENLNFKLENVSSISKKLKVEIPYEKVKAEMEKAMEHLSNTVVIKGFRKGKAPRSVIEKQYSEAVRYEVTEQLINESYMQALKENNLEPAGYPKISDVKLEDGKPLTYEAEIEVRPEIEPKGYEGLELEGISTEPSDEEVDKIVLGFLDSRADMKTISDDRPVADSDWVDIDMEGSINGEAKKDLTVKAYVCQLGNKMSLIDEISKGIKGMKIGQEKDIKTKYADDYYAEDLRGKEVVFKVKLNKILERILPELTDELVKELKLAGTRDEFLKNVRDNLRKHKEEARNNDLRTQAIEKLLEKNMFDVPASEAQRKLPEIRERAIRNMFGYQAHSMPEKDINEALQKHEAEIKKASENDVRLSYILEAIAKKHSITSSAEDMQKEMEDAARSMNLTVAKLKEKYGESTLKHALGHSIIERKTLDYLCEKAKIVEKKVKKEAK